MFWHFFIFLAEEFRGSLATSYLAIQYYLRIFWNLTNFIEKLKMNVGYSN